MPQRSTPSADWRGAREAKLDELHTQLTGAVEALVSGEDWTRAMVFAARFRSRSFANTLLIAQAHFAAHMQGKVPEAYPTYVAGFRQWESLGRHVVRGQHGYMIVAPVTRRMASSTPAVADSWRVLGFKEKAKPGETVRTKLVGVKPAYVWDVSQTAGEPVPVRPAPRLLEGESPQGLWEGLARLVRAEGFEVDRVGNAAQIGGANGLTNYVTRTVKVRSDMDDAAEVKTLAHELAHVRMHGPGEEGPRLHRGIGEVEAESVAMMVGAAHGMSTDSYTIPYVAGWATTVEGKTPIEVVQATGERVRKVALSILAGLDTEQIGAGDPPGLNRDKPTANLSPAPGATAATGRVMAVGA
jgi:hypothetical protein